MLKRTVVTVLVGVLALAPAALAQTPGVTAT
jgi:hypothetical protein